MTEQPLTKTIPLLIHTNDKPLPLTWDPYYDRTTPYSAWVGLFSTIPCSLLETTNLSLKFMMYATVKLPILCYVHTVYIILHKCTHKIASSVVFGLLL
jgi:hypothetical protein